MKMSGRIAHEDDEYREQFAPLGSTLRETARKACSTKLLKRRVPVSLWLPQYQPKWIFEDLVAGITVGLTAIPQSIAYAIVADLPPQYGLYSAFMGCFIYIFFGTCKAVTIGPTAIMAIMTQPYVGGKNPDFAVLLTFLKGILTFLLGFFNLGFLVQFISSSVISGFTTAAALTIASTQIKNLLGLPGNGAGFISSWSNFFRNAHKFQWGDTALGVFSIIFLWTLKKVGNHRGRFALGAKYLSLSRNAMVDLGGAVLAYILFHYGIQPFKLTGDIEAGFPRVGLPPFSTTVDNTTIGFIDMVKELGIAPVSVSLISILEGVTVATIFCEKSKTVDATQEMIAIGACNIGGSFFSSMPVTASFTRSAINNASGVRSPLGGTFTGVLVLLALGVLTPYFYYLPKATLAAVIISAMFATMEFKEIHETWKTRRVDVIPLLATLLCCLFIGLEPGILIGTGVNLFIVLYSNSRPQIEVNTTKFGENEALILVPNRDLIFSSADYFRYRLTKSIQQNPRCDFVIIDGKYIQTIDMSAAKKLTNLVESLRAQRKEIVLWNWSRQTSNVLIRHNVELKDLFVFVPKIEDLISHLRLQTVQTISITR